MPIARCFLTGVQFPMEDAFVLNRREARLLLSALSDRVACLRRLIEQLAPLDDTDDRDSNQPKRNPKAARRRHRLLCKAMAETIANAYPEVRLFHAWPEYRSQTRYSAISDMRLHRRFGQDLDKLTDAELMSVSHLGREVLKLVDKDLGLAASTRQAIALSTCARLRALNANEICKKISNALAGTEIDSSLGLEKRDLAAIRALQSKATGRGSAQSSRPAVHQ